MQVIDSEGYLKVKLSTGPAGSFVPYTGAIQNVDLGEYQIKVGQLELDQTPTGTAGVAVMRWNDTDGTADLGLKGGNVTLQIGQEQVTRVVNKTGTNLLEASYQAVRVDGAQGNRLKVALAQADNDANSADTLGLVTETINNNQEGFVTTSGLVRNINTTGSIQTETWLDGDALYLSGTVAGQITNIKPTAPIHTVIMGYVVRAHATQGQIYVKVDNGYELDELHNVAITTPLNNQVLQYETATSLWKNKTISTGITIGTTAITSGTVGRVLFEGTGNVVQESANLFWDNTNGRLGIGGTPVCKVQIITNNFTTTPPWSYDNTISQLAGATNQGLLATYSSTLGSFIGSVFPGNAWLNLTYVANNHIFSIAGTEAMRIVQATRNVLINTTTDAGYKLDVNGTARVVNQATIQTLTIGLGASSVATSTALGFEALNANTTGASTLAVGYQSLKANTTGQNNVALGSQALTANTTGNNNIAIGRNTSNVNTTGSQNIVIGGFSGTGNFSNTTILGYNDTATADNQMRFGSATNNNGAVTSEVNASTQVWNVIINGVARKILLA